MLELPENHIPLFPLGSALFPHARMPLQIFEPRYLDLVKHCMRTDTGFGVVMIEQGSEVYQRGQDELPNLVSVGCYARIVDWDQLPHNRLGITIEGSRRFSPGRLSSARNHLMSADVHWWEDESDCELPERLADLAHMLADLLRHPQVGRLGYQLDLDSGLKVGFQLAQLLPLDEKSKIELLDLRDPMARLEQIDYLVKQIIEE